MIVPRRMLIKRSKFIIRAGSQILRWVEDRYAMPPVVHRASLRGEIFINFESKARGTNSGDLDGIFGGGEYGFRHASGRSVNSGSLVLLTGRPPRPHLRLDTRYDSRAFLLFMLREGGQSKLFHPRLLGSPRDPESCLAIGGSSVNETSVESFEPKCRGGIPQGLIAHNLKVYELLSLWGFKSGFERL